jgi:hypothetical protein
VAKSFIGLIDEIADSPKLRKRLDELSKKAAERRVKKLREIWKSRHRNGAFWHAVKHEISMIRVLRKPLGGY